MTHIYCIKIPEELKVIFTLRDSEPRIFDAVINNIIRINNLKIIDTDEETIGFEEGRNLKLLLSLTNEYFTNKESIVKAYVKLNEFFSYYVYLDNLDNYVVFSYDEHKIILKGVN